MLRTAVIVAVTGILMAILLSWWATARITRRCSAWRGARGVAPAIAAQVEVRSTDEIGQLARAFNRMTHRLWSSASGWCRPSAWRRGANWRGGWRTS